MSFILPKLHHLKKNITTLDDATTKSVNHKTYFRCSYYPQEYRIKHYLYLALISLLF